MKPVGKLTPVKTPVGKLTPVEEDQEDPVIEHLKLREGVKYESYLDTLGKLTGGVGHLMSKEEQALYPEGTEIPSEVVDEWLKADVQEARKAAQKQAQELSGSKELEEALIHVNFQLGSGWNKIHKNTWSLMKQGKYEEAAKEAADSKWYEQTEVRVKDFQKALRAEGTK